MNEPCFAIVLGGGGGRGAFQVGALRALLEAGITADLLVGTSIGALNAAGMALWGNDLTAVLALEMVYDKATDAGLFDTHLPVQMFQALTGYNELQMRQRAEAFLAATGFDPRLTFGDLSGPRLAVIGTDLDGGRPVLYGRDPATSILEGVMTSMTLPPWFLPVEYEGRQVMDGGVVSNLPIEPAMTLGATEIIALDIDDPASMPHSGNPAVALMTRMYNATGLRLRHLELELARARGVPVHRLELRSEHATPVWDFSRHRELIALGYEITAAWIPTWHDAPGGR